MQEKLKQQVLNTFLLVMRPIVRILLRYGIGYREFVEVVKTAFVDVASSDFGLRGRPQISDFVVDQPTFLELR